MPEVHYVGGVARPKDQSARRQQLITATMRTIAERGLAGTTMKQVADAAGTSARLVAYYYADLESLVEAAHQVATERYFWARHRTISGEEAPPVKLARLIRSGLPDGEDLLLSQVLNEIAVSAGRSPMHATLMTLLFDREMSLYVSVLESGRASGDFTLAEPSDTLARNFVLLEDALGLHLLGHNSSLNRERAHQQLASYARTATGRAALPVVAAGGD